MMAACLRQLPAVQAAVCTTLRTANSSAVGTALATESVKSPIDLRIHYGVTSSSRQRQTAASQHRFKGYPLCKPKLKATVDYEEVEKAQSCVITHHVTTGRGCSPQA